MTGVADVGDAVQLTFTTTTGATVAMQWLDPDQNTVTTVDPVPETPTGSGNYVTTLLATAPGVWTAVFTASGTATGVERYYVRAAAPGPLPLATVGDVTGQFGTLTTPETELSRWLLRLASSLVRSQFPQVDTDLVAGRLDPEVVALGVTNMVLRVLRNPLGLRALTVGPFSRTFDTTTAAGLLVLTAAETSHFTPISQAAAAAVAMGTIMVHRAGPPPGCWDSERAGVRRWWGV